MSLFSSIKRTNSDSSYERSSCLQFTKRLFISKYLSPNLTCNVIYSLISGKITDLCEITSFVNLKTSWVFIFNTSWTRVFNTSRL